MASQRPSDARKEYLNGLPKDQQADVMRGAEDRGVGPNDYVWLEMLAAQEAAKKIEIASSEAAAASAEAADRIERAAVKVEELVAVGGLGEIARKKIEEVAADVKTLLLAPPRVLPGPAASSSWRWLKVLAAVAAGLLLALAISLSASVATRQQDLGIARELLTPAGVAALELVRANPDLNGILARCPREVDSGQTVMTCRLFALGHREASAHPTWLSGAAAVVAGWPSPWLAAALAVALVAIAVLSWEVSRRPATRRIWPRGR